MAELKQSAASGSADTLPALREEVRRFLSYEATAGSYKRDAAGWDRYDPAFSKKVAERSWIGMTWPSEYGGHGRSSLERYVVTEELLTAGAPVRAHWLADRQIGPLLLGAGSEWQKRFFLPRIAAGDCYICLAMSEPDSGSDLASIKTRARKVADGWRIDGQKAWISYAHKAHYMNLFARTSPATKEDRRAGVTQFLVDLKSPGISVNPIINLAGDHDLNEVILSDVHVPDEMVIGAVGKGWKQASGELAHERSSPERWLNSYNVLVRLVEQMNRNPDQGESEGVGRLVAHIWCLHSMSFAIAAQRTKPIRGISVDVQAAILKDLGNQLDQEMPDVARKSVPGELVVTDPRLRFFCESLSRSLLYSPSYTLRGGSREILRGIIARGLGLR